MAPGSAAATPVRPEPGPAKYHLVRLVLKIVAVAYVRIRHEGVERIPD